ncbi:holin family protein [Nioella nitratireducens]|uniref:holin family protein n=1 Tax=Nioella nitratireducens TaxID=1287720 RepID=UPI0008FD7A1C|nr:holin family protein [Nioella nitratireducens]
MGLISRALGGADALSAAGSAVSDVAEVFHANETRALELSAAAQRAALDAQGDEFQYARPGLFDRIINGINRMPRPFLALGTIGLFVFAMVDPVAFSGRMEGLNAVPEPLWWLLGAIVSFYFGAREMHYFRTPNGGRLPRMQPEPVAADAVAGAGDVNPALERWLAQQRESDRGGD